jgi:hypothetical protein
MDRQKLHSSYSNPAYVLDHRWIGQSTISAAQFFRYGWVKLGVATHMHLVDDGSIPRHAWRSSVAPRERRINPTAACHKRRTVAIIESEIVTSVSIL